MGKKVDLGNILLEELKGLNVVSKNEKGLVDIHEERYIGCKMCIVVCPYDARFSHSTKKVANKGLETLYK